jgi:hypothetical protein
MTKLELKEWITELACSLDRGDLKIDELMNEVEEIVDKNVTEQLTLTDVVNCVYVVTERDNYGEQLFRQVFAKEEQAIEYLSKQGLTADNIDEINEIELD